MRSADTNLQSNDAYRLLVDSITDYAIYMLDANGIVSNWNAGAQRFKGYRADEIIGSHFSRFYDEADRAVGLPTRALQISATEGKFEAEGWRLRKDGSRFWAHVVIDPIRGADGEIIGYAKITRDLTERQAAQQELERAREALFQAQKMEAIGQLTGGIAHDFNNLLMAILSSLELLGKRLPDDPMMQRLVDNAVQGAERGATLTQRMLAFARRQDLNPVSVDIATTVLGMADLLQRSLGPAWSIDTRFPLSLSAVAADVNQLEMALLNLVVNARDAMAEGGIITIQASEHLVSEGEVPPLVAGKYVKLSVTDTGSGMDPKTLARAMEPFFTTKGVGKGTGLGLSMIHGFADQLNGAFLLRSTLGAGTTAEIWLPNAKTAPDTPATQTVVAAAPPTASLTILAVDDDSLILMNTAALLEDLGHTVLTADGGEEALRIFREQPEIGLVITDQAMPGMTGLDLVAAMRVARPGVPIILATGYGELPNQPTQPVLRLGKPFNQADLRRSVTMAMAPDPS